jgi:6-phosphofructokinase 2
VTVKTILTVTFNPALDVCAEVPVVAADHKLHCTPAEHTPGGGGINVARAIHRLGASATALFPYGGSSGERLCELLRAEGVPIAGVPIAGTTREDFSVRETTTGHEYRFVLPGPPLAPDELEACVDAILGRADWGSFVVLSGSMPPGVGPEAIEELVGRLHAGGSLIVVDTSGPALAAFARAGVLILKPSLNELSGHTGRRLTAVDEIVEAAEALRRSGPNQAVVVSLGADGALLLPADRAPCAITAPAVSVVSAVGAGDSLVAGLVVGLAGGEALVDAARRGVAAGTAATVSPGHHLCHPADVDRLLADVSATPLRWAGSVDGAPRRQPLPYDGSSPSWPARS